MYFFLKCKKPRKTQGLQKKPRKNPRPSRKTQEPKIRSKNPRSWEKTKGVATLYVGLRSEERMIERRKETKAGVYITDNGRREITAPTPDELFMKSS